MLKTYLYIPDDLDKKIMKLADADNLSKAATIRYAITEGLDTISKKLPVHKSSLMEIVEIGRRLKLKGPKDLSKNHDKYLYEE